MQTCLRKPYRMEAFNHYPMASELTTKGEKVGDKANEITDVGAKLPLSPTCIGINH